MEREYVAFMVIKKFPFLADTIGTGIGSWQTAIKHRFKNLRKTKHDPQRAASVTDPKGPQIKRRKVQGVPELLEGETEETCKEHIKTLKKEMQKTSNKSQALIKELMDITFPYKRQELMETGVLVEDFLNQYPALQFVSEMKAELARITGEKNVTKTMADSLIALLPRLLKLAEKNSTTKLILDKAKDLVQQDPEKRSEIEEAAGVVVLTILLKERGCQSAVLKMCSDDESLDDNIKASTVPRLLGSGDLSCIDPLYIAAKGRIVTRLSGTSVEMSMALVLLMAVFYIFNMEYNPKAKNVYIFLETVLLGKSGEAKKRVPVNKFLKELNNPVTSNNLF